MVDITVEPKGIRSMIGRKMTKSVKFMGEDIKISKLSVAEVIQIQQKSKEVNAEADDSNGFSLLKTVITLSVEGAAQLEDKDFEAFPMDELSKLSTEIMKFSGLTGDNQGK
jgi:hypothetical protein